MVLSLTRRTALCFLLIGLFSQSASAHVSPGQHRVFAPVLIYHHVKPFTRSDDAIERGLTITPSQFEAELHFLAVRKYHAVTALQLVRHLRTGAALPPNPVVLTFDDGYKDVYTNVYKRLRRNHMTATFFIVPGFLGTPRYLTWSQVEDMARHGMDVEAHTMDHQDLSLVSAAKLSWELKESRRILERRLGRRIALMAYPYGSFNARVLRAVASAGYWAAFTTQQGWWSQRSQLRTLPRVYVDNDDSTTIFAGRLQGNPAVLAEDP